MPHQSSPELLAPHSLRVLGHASVGQVAALRALPSSVVEEALEDLLATLDIEHGSDDPAG